MYAVGMCIALLSTVTACTCKIGYTLHPGLKPRTPFNSPGGRGGLVNIVHLCTSTGISYTQGPANRVWSNLGLVDA